MKYINKITIIITVCIFVMIGNFLLPQSTYAASKKVAFIGSSSFARGCNASKTKGLKYDGFIEILQKDTSLSSYQFDCKQTTKGGTGYTFFLEKWRDDVKGNGYHDLVLYAGLNGIGNKPGDTYGLDMYKKNLNIIITEAKKEGMRVIVMSAQPYKGYSSWTSTAGQNILTNNAVLKNHPNVDIYIDVYNAVVDETDNFAIKSELTHDKLHLNKKGNEIQAQLLLQQAYGKSIMVGGLPVFSEVELILQKPQTRITIPGLSFTNIEDLVEETDSDGSKYIYFPFLGEYFAAIYKYAIIVIAVISIVMIINSGLEWILSGGSSEKITEAKNHLTRSIIGLFLVLGSYTLLYTINPELVKFRNLRVLTVKGVSIEGIEYINEEAYKTLTGGKKMISKEEALKIAREAANNVGLDECIFVAIVKKESGGYVNAIGHDENVTRSLPSSRVEFINSGETYSGRKFPPVDLSGLKKQLNDSEFKKKNPDIAKNHETAKILNDDGPKYVDISKLVPPDYGIDWRFTKGHGFGMAQIQIFKNRYCDKSAGIRGRTIGGVCYTIPELLDPVKNMEASARLFKINLDGSIKSGKTGDAAIKDAFRKYNNSSAYAVAAMKYYNDCKSGT
jgi:hypothetical protein